MRIGIDIAQTCLPKAGCGWVAECMARAFLEHEAGHQYIFYHHFDSWINTSTRSPLNDLPLAAAPFRDLSAQDGVAAWNSIRERGIIPGAPDVVHANSYNAPRIENAKLVFTVYDVGFWAHPEHTTEANRHICQRGMLDALANADGFWFISDFTRREFDKYSGGWLQQTRKPWLVQPLAPRHPPPADGWTKPTDGAWLCVGTLEPRKNLDCLLDAYRIYAETSAIKRPLRLVGAHGWMCEGLVNRISRWDGPGIVQHAGYLPDPDLLHEYRASFGLVFPSIYEGFGLPVVEAMNQQTPVICGNLASLPEIGGQATIFVDPLTPAAIASAMLALEDDPAAYRQRALHCLHQAERFSWSRVAHALAEFDARLIGAA